MLRTVVYILIALFLISIIRMFAGVLARGIGEMFQPSQPDTAAKPGGASTATGGELKRDPVCGTFVATSTSMRKIVEGETLYFCSPECRDKYAG